MRSIMAEIPQNEIPDAGWRLKLGVTLFALSILLPVIGVPLVTTLGLSTTAVATASGALLAGAEVLGIISVATMGKPGFAYIKNRVFGFLRQYGPPAEVSRTRYRFGLLMFAVPVMFGWLAPYAAELIPGYRDNVFTYAVAGDLILLTSFFVLGGDFWDKLRALFFHEAKAVFPQTAD